MLNKEQLIKDAEKKYQSLTFRDDFLFCKILTNNPDIAKDLIEMILNKKIKKVVPQKQFSIEITSESRGVRLDVYLDDTEETVYDLEMQTTSKKELPKRMRYYQGMIDLNLIERGANFSELKKSYIIFICTSDPYKMGKYYYSFENLCTENPNLSLGDETYKIILNTSGTKNDVSENLQEFCNLINSGTGKTDLCKRINDEVQKSK
ncbi:MAG: Rpn family recombination-promoting nuclease/putative transposase, partial [Lachnospiraceae bacterium]|nr:Rpn family recombination-promoting nuclease/putative transposase [Lachnospiraceae bacterium]